MLATQLSRVFIKNLGKQERTFDLLEDARLWRKTFDGTNEEKIQNFINISSQPPLKTVWQIMQRDHFPTLASSTQNIWKRRYTLLEEIDHVPIDKLTSSVITSWVQRQVKYFKDLKIHELTQKSLTVLFIHTSGKIEIIPSDRTYLTKIGIYPRMKYGFKIINCIKA